MDEQDWMHRDSGQPFTVTPEDAQASEAVRRRQSHNGLTLLLALILAAVATLSCMALGLRLRFSRFEGGFSLQLAAKDGAAAQTDPLPATPQRQPETDASQPEAENSVPRVEPSEDTQVQPSAPENETLPTVSGAQAGALSLAGESETLTYQQIYQKLSPSVCSISAVWAGAASSGSGIVLTQDGYLATNAHVVSGAQAVSVTLSDGRSFDAQLIGTDSVSDLAVLKIAATGLTAAQFGDSDALQVGDTVVAIGDPLGIDLRGTMTDGIISAINRDLEVDGRTMTLLQTNAALNEGNSGGPLINMEGQVIGINTMKMSSYSVSIEGLGFAIPSASAVPILDELMTQGYISGRPDAGFDGITVPVYAQFYYRLPSGVYIQDVQTDSDAAAAGVSPGDVLTQFDGREITSLEDLKQALSAHAAGDTVTVVIYRRGSYYSLELTLAEATN